ncbi:MAG: hypothetical protein ABIJ57_02455 [Pseudomonadota bacterium]
MQLAQELLGRLGSGGGDHGFPARGKRRGSVGLALHHEHGLFRLVWKWPRAEQPLLGTLDALDLAAVRKGTSVRLPPARADPIASSIPHGEMHLAGRLGVAGLGSQGAQGFRLPPAHPGQFLDGVRGRTRRRTRAGCTGTAGLVLARQVFRFTAQHESHGLHEVTAAHLAGQGDGVQRLARGMVVEDVLLAPQLARRVPVLPERRVEGRARPDRGQGQA